MVKQIIVAILLIFSMLVLASFVAEHGEKQAMKEKRQKYMQDHGVNSYIEK